MYDVTKFMYQIAPENPRVLATVAHFLAQEGGNVNEACQLFADAIKLQPTNPLYIVRYAKVLRQCKQLGRAELMYRVAVDHSIGNRRMHPMALCNYATFLFKYRKNTSSARDLFEDGLNR